MTLLLYAVFFIVVALVGGCATVVMMMGRDAEEREEEPPRVMPRIWDGDAFERRVRSSIERRQQTDPKETPSEGPVT